MKRRTSKFTVISSAILGLALISSGPGVWAEDDGIPFSEAHLFFELNNTDGDLGIHALIDGDAWKKLEIEDPNERKILNVRVGGRLQRQGLTEIFFESAEPQFDELPPQRFFRRFPAGIYEIGGKTLDGKELESEVQLTHVMPAPPEPYVNGLPMAQQCDEEEPGFDATVTSAPITIFWDPVMKSHPDPNGGGAGVQPPVDVIIHNYEVVLEVNVDMNGEEFASKLQVILPPGETSITVPDEFLAQGEEFKYEVLAREASYNQTAVESCFKVE
jgi:hypothetical protein